MSAISPIIRMQGDDKIESEAKRDRIDPMEIVETFMRSYFEDMDRLGVERPNISPRATGHIVEQIELAKILIDERICVRGERECLLRRYKVSGIR